MRCEKGPNEGVVALTEGRIEGSVRAVGEDGDEGGEEGPAMRLREHRVSDQTQNATQCHRRGWIDRAHEHAIYTRQPLQIYPWPQLAAPLP